MKRLPILLLLLVLCQLTACSYTHSNQEGAHLLRDPQQTTVSTAPSKSMHPSETEPYTTAVPTSDCAGTTTPTGGTEPFPLSDDTFVKVSDYIPDAVIDLRYATDENFTQRKIYNFDTVFLRYGTVKKLMQVQTEVRKDGYILKIWDGFRPTAAQQLLWEIYPDPTYVSDPSKGFTSHCRGNTVDITLVTFEGNEVAMPSKFDDFSALADRDYSDCPKDAAANAIYLEEIMLQYGFRGYKGEWWHYTDTTDYPVSHTFDPAKEE